MFLMPIKHTHTLMRLLTSKNHDNSHSREDRNLLCCVVLSSLVGHLNLICKFRIYFSPKFIYFLYWILQFTPSLSLSLCLTPFIIDFNLTLFQHYVRHNSNDMGFVRRTYFERGMSRWLFSSSHPRLNIPFSYPIKRIIYILFLGLYFK